MPMIPEAIEHAAPTRKANAGHDPDREAGERGTSATVGRLDERDDHADDHRADDGEDRDRRVLAPDEGDGALEDRAGDVLHRLRALCRATARRGPGRGRTGSRRCRRSG